MGNDEPQSRFRRRNLTLITIIAAPLTVLVIGGLIVLGALAGRQIVDPQLPTGTLTPTYDPQKTPFFGPVGVIFDRPIEGTQVVPDGTVIAYGTNPPTSGAHYATPTLQGIYDQPQPDGAVVASMARGFVVIWYNCFPSADPECSDLLGRLKRVVSNSSAVNSLIMMPRARMGFPLALTAWGKLVYLDWLDEQLIDRFIHENVGHGPKASSP